MASPVVMAAEAMRTRFEIVLVDDRDPASLRAAAEEALGEVARVESDLSVFRPEATLARLNAGAAQAPMAIDGVMIEFLERVGGLVDDVEGAFDPTVGALLALLRGAEEVLDESSDESWEKSWARALSQVGFRRQVRVDRASSTVAFAQPGVRLDPGAIGKGWALERAVAVLREAGVVNALLHGGTSSVYGMGAPEGTAGWAVAIQDPLKPDGRLGRVVLRDQALGISAIHGRFFRRGGTRVGHVLDPRTGAAVSRNLMAAVVTASPTDADAVSTALLVLGGEALDRLGARFVDASLLVAEAQGQGMRIHVREPVNVSRFDRPFSFCDE